MSKTVALPNHVRPTPNMIGRNGKTKRLYELEEKRNAAIKACALFDTLESYEPGLSEAVAIAWLEHRGFQVSKVPVFVLVECNGDELGIAKQWRATCTNVEPEIDIFFYDHTIQDAKARVRRKFHGAKFSDE